MLIQPYQDRYHDGTLELWCHDTESNVVLVNIKNPPIFAYLELPIIVNRTKIDWKERYESFFEYLKVAVDTPIKSCDLVDGSTLYFYRGEYVNSFLRLHFEDEQGMKEFESFTEPTFVHGFGKLYFKLWESQISPKRRLFTHVGCKYSEWISIDVSESRVKRTVASVREYDGVWQTMKPSRETDISVTPGIMSWDIETYSDNHRKLPDPENPDHVAYQISCVYQKGKDSRRVLLTTVPTNPIPGVQVRVSRCEYQMILDFARVIEVLDPTVLIGYNIFKYDYDYLHRRLPITRLSWPQSMSRIVGDTPKMFSKVWYSKAYGRNEMSFPMMTGRMSVDLLTMIRREYSFPKYSLDYVCKSLLGRGKHDVSAPQMFSAYENSRDGKEGAIEEMTKVALYCVEDSQLVLDLFESLNTWIGLVEMSSVMGVSMMDLFISGQQVRVVSQIYDLCKRMKPEVIMNSRPNPPDYPFEGAFVGEPIVGISRLVHVLDFKSLYPSIMIAYNICYTTLVAPEVSSQISDEECHVVEFGTEDVIGDEEEAIASRHHKFRFIKGKRGVMPELARSLIAERDSVRSILSKVKSDASKAEGDEKRRLNTLAKVLDKRQNALKISVNSGYGLLGVKNGGMLPLLEAAMCITAKGRHLIRSANEFLVKRFNATIVYNDTDSSMVQIPECKDSSQCHEWGKRLSAEVSDQFPDAIRMEYEKSMDMILFTKKRYAALEFSPDGSYLMSGGKEKIYSRGVVMVRRDNFKLLRDLFETLVRGALLGNDVRWGSKVLFQDVVRLLRSETPISDLSYTGSVGSSYKNPNYPMAIFKERLKTEGKPPEVGERIEYVIVEPTQEGEKQGHMMRELDTEEELNMSHYFNALVKPITQLFQVVWKDASPVEMLVGALTLHGPLEVALKLDREIIPSL